MRSQRRFERRHRRSGGPDGGGGGRGRPGGRSGDGGACSRGSSGLGRLPCGCDPVVLAAKLGMPVDELLRAAARAEGNGAEGDGPVLITVPRWTPPRGGPPDDETPLN